jgi:phenylalanyl-tRNA synthetase alpha chain
MGFSIAEGPEVELSVYDLKAEYPRRPYGARVHDTFYIAEDESVHLRCQTSPVQVRVMERQKPPIRIISPGRVYRKTRSDATHSPCSIKSKVWSWIRVSPWKSQGDAEHARRQALRTGDANAVSPAPFPVHRALLRVDVQCFSCGGAGCRVCKGEGWIELLGAGMVHPKVLAGCGIDPEVYSGFAFGIGLERMTLLRYNIDDMRLIFENDMRFLSQF